MAGVGLTGKIVPLNGGNFPVFEDINGQGGYRAVPTIADRNLLTMTGGPFLKVGMLVLVQALQCVYSLDPGLATWSFFTSLTSLAKQPAWFVDSAAGSDDNDGTALASALRTVEELSARLCPGGRVFQLVNAVTVQLRGTLGILSLNVDWGNFVLRVSGQVASSAPITIATIGAANPAANVRGQITTAAGAFVAKQRIRVVSGAAAGAMTICTGLNGPATSAFVTALWYNFLTSSVAAPAPGDQVVVDTLSTSITSINVRSQGGQSLATSGWFEVDDLILKGFNSENFSTAEQPFVIGCDVGPAAFVYDHDGNGVSFANCRILGGNFYGRNCRFGNCSFQSVAAFNALCNFAFVLANTLDGGSITVGGSSVYGGPSHLLITNNIEHQNGAGLTAYKLFPGARMTVNGLMWGGTASPYALKGDLASGAWIYTAPTMAQWALASVQDWSLTGHAVANAGAPIGYPRADCGLAINPDPAAVGVTT